VQYYTLSPEVAGGIGRNTVMMRTQHPPIVSHLHYELDGWLGDDLLEALPGFVWVGRFPAENEGSRERRPVLSQGWSLPVRSGQ